MESLAQLLVLHGSLVLLSGFLGGIFFARAIKRENGEVAWRVVHAGASMGGIMLIALGPAIPQLALPPWEASLIAWSLIVGIEVFVVGMVLAAVSGKRGLTRRGDTTNRLVWALYTLGSILTLVGCTALAWGAATSVA
jgi:FtsH-binding integral membrane protein